MEQKPDNVIPFPGPKKKAAPEPPRKPTLFFDFENRKVMLSASIGSILLLAALVNPAINSFSEKERVALNDLNRPARGIASVNKNPDYDQQILRGLASTDSRSEVASIGRRPNALEKLRFGQLSGNYAMQFTNGKVHSLRYVERDDSLPKYLNDREQFIWKNSDVLPVQFDTVTRLKPTKEQGMTYEVYRLSKADKPVGQVRFELDKFGRLFSMKVQKGR